MFTIPVTQQVALESLLTRHDVIRSRTDIGRRLALLSVQRASGSLNLVLAEVDETFRDVTRVLASTDVRELSLADSYQLSDLEKLIEPYIVGYTVITSSLGLDVLVADTVERAAELSDEIKDPSKLGLDEIDYFGLTLISTNGETAPA